MAAKTLTKKKRQLYQLKKKDTESDKIRERKTEKSALDKDATEGRIQDWSVHEIFLSLSIFLH